MSGADTWMPLYIGDYLADTAHLTQTQHGGYLLLLMTLWRQNGKCPDDDDLLARVTRSTSQEWKKLRPTLEKLCTVENGFWTQKRLTIELEKTGRRYKSKVENGRLGGMQRSRTVTAGPTGRLATGSDSHGRPLSDGGVQPQPQLQPQGNALSVVEECRASFDGHEGQL